MAIDNFFFFVGYRKMKFTETHEWVEVEEGVATIGISNYAQKELGEIVYVELPEVGKQIQIGEESAVLESTKAAADVYAPLTGRIEEVNKALKNAPGLINSAPESEGWIFKVAITNGEELQTLMDEDSYRAKFQA